MTKSSCYLMPERSLCEMHDSLGQFFEEWGGCSYNRHIEIHYCSCHSYSDFSRSTGLTAEFELFFHPQKWSISSAKEGASEIEVTEKTFPGLGVGLHFTMEDYESQLSRTGTLTNILSWCCHVLFLTSAYSLAAEKCCRTAFCNLTLRSVTLQSAM